MMTNSTARLGDIILLVLIPKDIFLFVGDVVVLFSRLARQEKLSCGYLWLLNHVRIDFYS